MLIALVVMIGGGAATAQGDDLEQGKHVRIDISLNDDGWHIVFGEPSLPVKLSEIELRYYTHDSASVNRLNVVTLSELIKEGASNVFVRYVQAIDESFDITLGDYLWLNPDFFFLNDTVWFSNIHSDMMSYPWLYLHDGFSMVLDLDPLINEHNRLMDIYSIIGLSVFICGAIMIVPGIIRILLKKPTETLKWNRLLFAVSIILMFIGLAVFYYALSSFMA
jgi:hypothetical protein